MMRRMSIAMAMAAVIIVLVASLAPGTSTRAQEPMPSPWADVRAFGAVGDGSADDTAAFKRALATGLPLLIPQPKAQFVVKETLVVGSGQAVTGVSMGRSLVKFTGTGALFTSDPDASKKTRDITFRDFTIVGTGNKNAIGIMLVRTTDPIIENLHIRDIGGIGLVMDGERKGSVDQAHYAYIANLHVAGTNRIGVQFRGPGVDEGTNRHRVFFLRVSGSTEVGLDIGKQSSTSNYFGYTAENVHTAVRIAGRHNFFYGLQVETATGHGVEFVKGATGNRFVGTTMAKVSGSQWANPDFNPPRRGEGAGKEPDFAK